MLALLRLVLPSRKDIIIVTSIVINGNGKNGASKHYYDGVEKEVVLLSA